VANEPVEGEVRVDEAGNRFEYSGGRWWRLLLSYGYDERGELAEVYFKPRADEPATEMPRG
jgi:hypothetical protein